MHNTQSVIGIHIVLRFKLPATPAQSRCGKGAGVPREEPAEPGPLPGSESTKGQTNSGRDTFSIQRGREKRPGGRQELDEELLDEDELELLELSESLSLSDEELLEDEEEDDEEEDEDEDEDEAAFFFFFFFFVAAAAAAAGRTRLGAGHRSRKLVRGSSGQTSVESGRFWP